MKKVCHLLDTLGIGGLEKTVIDIAGHLSGYDHHIWCVKDPGPLAPVAEKDGLRVRAFGFEGRAGVRRVRELAHAMRAEGFSIVHSHGHFPSVWGRMAGVAAGIPVRILHAQNVYYVASVRNRLRLRVLDLVTQQTIAVSEAVKESLIRTTGIPASKVAVIYNSAPDMKAGGEADRDRMRQGFGLADSFVVGCVGRLEEHKGHRLVVEAVAQCLGQGVDVRCLMVGDGQYRAALEKRVRESGRAERFVFTGMRNDIASLLAAMDVFVQPSTLREGLPLVLAEAASAGLPLIATPIGGNGEVVVEGVNGYLVPVNDAAAIAGRIAHLARHAAEARSMGAASRQVWGERFTRGRMVDAVRAVYDRYCNA